MAPGVPACFFFADQVPKETTGLQVALACEKSAPGGIYGTQKIKGLWRLYTWTKEARDQLLIKGILINRVHISISDANPNIVDNSVETTKLIIGNVPMSVANAEIEKVLRSMPDVTFKSKLFDESYRDEDGKLTAFKSGRRYVYIQKPRHPLPKFVQIIKWRATLYHAGQKASAAIPPIPSFSDAAQQMSTGTRDSDPVTRVDSPSEAPQSTHSSEPARHTNPPNLLTFFRKTTGKQASNVDIPPKPISSLEPVALSPLESASSKEPASQVSTPVRRGRKQSRKPTSRQSSRSASGRRKRYPSEDEDLMRSDSKSRRSDFQPLKNIPDYFDFDPTQE